MMVAQTKILVVNGGIITLLRDGKMDTVPNTVYNQMKFGEFEGNKRIYHDFGEERTILETYDDGIFNCTVKGETVQLRDGEQVAQAIVEHREHGTVEIIKKLYVEKMDESYSDKAIKEFLEPFIENGRVQVIENGFLIDKRFKVTKQSQAQHFKDNAWGHLCIVVQNEIVPFEIDTPFGTVEISRNTIEVLSKVLFLLKPNTADDVFMDQLTKDVREQLLRDFPPPPPECLRTSDFQHDEDGFPVQCTGVMETYDSTTGLKVCNVCKKPSEEDQKKHDEEMRALKGLPADATRIEEFVGEQNEPNTTSD